MNEYMNLIVTGIISGLGCGSLAWIFTIKFTRKQAEADAMTSVQNVYQELIEDLKNDRDELRTENQSLKEELRAMHERFDSIETQCRENARKVEKMMPFLCYCKDCKLRESSSSI